MGLLPSLVNINTDYLAEMIRESNIFICFFHVFSFSVSYLLGFTHRNTEEKKIYGKRVSVTYNSYRGLETTGVGAFSFLV